MNDDVVFKRSTKVILEILDGLGGRVLERDIRKAIENEGHYRNLYERHRVELLNEGLIECVSENFKNVVILTSTGKNVLGKIHEIKDILTEKGRKP